MDKLFIHIVRRRAIKMENGLIWIAYHHDIGKFTIGQSKQKLILGII